MHITGSIDIENPDHEYLIILNRGGLTIPSPNLVNYVCDAFAVLSATENILINQSKLTLRKISTASVRKDNVASFKKQKRETIA